MCKARKDHVGCPMLGSCDSCVHPCGFTPKEIKDVENNESINADLLAACEVSVKVIDAQYEALSTITAGIAKKAGKLESTVPYPEVVAKIKAAIAKATQ